MTSLSLLIVDDDPTARRTARNLLEADDEIDIIGDADAGQEAIDRIRSEHPHIVLLDVQMPDVDGLAVLQMLEPATIPAIVFSTDPDEDAVQAFEVAEADYVMKPFTRAAFETAVGRAKDRVRAGSQEERGRALRRLAIKIDWERPLLDRILVEERHRTFLLPIDEIDWLEEDGKYVVLHAGNERHYVRVALRSLEQRLPADRFAQLNQSAVVNLDRIVQLRPGDHDQFTVILTTGDEVSLSRRYRARLPELFGRARSPSRRA
jgi:two-component system LytT family response regulator